MQFCNKNMIGEFLGLYVFLFDCSLASFQCCAICLSNTNIIYRPYGENKIANTIIIICGFLMYCLLFNLSIFYLIFNFRLRRLSHILQSHFVTHRLAYRKNKDLTISNLFSLYLFLNIFLEK